MTTDMPNVLTVDDDSRLLRGLSRGLEESDYYVLTAISVAEAGVHLERERIDVVVSVQRMPGVTGLTFLSAIKEQYPWIRRVILSGTVEAYSGWDLSRHAHGILEKPCSVERLQQEIETVLQAELR